MTQLAESVAAMEARRSRLHAQLAKLNGEILTSELPRAGSGLPLSPPQQKRRRISEVIGLTGDGRTGIGSPRRVICEERRAVSGMTRLTEEVEGSGLNETWEAGAAIKISKVIAVSWVPMLISAEL